LSAVEHPGAGAGPGSFGARVFGRADHALEALCVALMIG